MDANLARKLELHMKSWREKHPEESLSDMEVLHRILEELGIEPGAKVEFANNKCNSDEVHVRLTFTPIKPVEYIEIDFEVIGPKKKKRRLR